MTGARLFNRRHVLSMGGVVALGGLASTECGAAALSTRQTASKSARIINAGGDPTLVLQEVLKQQRFFEQLGLSAITDNLGDGTKVMAALFSGSEDISVLSGFSQVFPAVERGAKMKIIAGSSLKPELAVYSKKPEVKSLKDLEGKVVGTSSPGALLYMLMIALFEKNGVDYTKVRFVNLGDSASVFRAVVAGVVDAGPAPINVYNQQAKYGVHALTDGNMWIELPEYTFQAAFTTDAAIAKKRDILVRVLAAYAKLYRFIQSPRSKDAFIEAWLTVLPGSKKELIRKEAEYQWSFFQKIKPFAVDLVLSESRINYIQHINKLVGNQDKLVPYDQVADMSLAEDALKLIS